jgi:hypothetical protein
MAGEPREKWVRRVEQLRRSGLRVREFAAREGVNAQTLMWWRWRLRAEHRDDHRGRVRREREPARGEARGALTKAKRRGSVRSELEPDRGGAHDVLAKTPIDFVELVTSVAAEPFEVEGAGRYRVRVPVRFESAALARLLDVLEER